MGKLAQPFDIGPNSCYKRVERSTSALLTSSPIADVRGSQTAIEVRKVTLAGELHLSHQHPEDTGSLEPFFFFFFMDKNKTSASRLFYKHITLGFFCMCH